MSHLWGDTMQTIIIEWRYLDVAGETCQRCSETGREISQVVERLRAECATKGVDIIFKETRLNLEQITHSNAILINGVPLESILPHTLASANCCASCGNLTGRPEQCRTLIHSGQEYEAIPQELIRQAVCQIGRCC